MTGFSPHDAGFSEWRSCNYFLTNWQHFPNRTDGHKSGTTLQLHLQYQRLPCTSDGSGPGTSVLGQPGVPGGSGHAQC